MPKKKAKKKSKAKKFKVEKVFNAGEKKVMDESKKLEKNIMKTLEGGRK